MSTPTLSDTFMDDCVAWFATLAPRDQMLFLLKVIPRYGGIVDPAGVDAAKQRFEARNGEANHDDVKQMLHAITGN